MPSPESEVGHGSSHPPQFQQELNPAQLAAVSASEGPQLVIAGAGSGKTRTLVYRVANLVHQGVSPESILLLTFTRRAAQEMLRRASRILDQRCGRVAGGTFHSFANLTLRRHAKLLGYTGNFTILDRSDAGDLVGLLRARYTEDRERGRFPRKETIVDLLSKQVNTQCPLQELVEQDYPHFAGELEALTELAEAYRQRKRDQNVMDFDDLLVNLRDLLANQAEVRQRLGRTYRYVMVDEFQDTNRLQAHIAALLASGHGNLMVVGDDAQSIYSFRGANFRNIMDFPKLFPSAKLTVLEQNYRSTQPLLDFSNAVIANAAEKYSKTLFSDLEGDRLPRYVRTDDEHSQSAYVCERILELREEGVPLREIAVLSRAAWHSNNLEIELANRNLPFKKFGGIRFVEAAHIKDLAALLKVAVNPRDETGWHRALLLLEGIGPKTAGRLTRRLLDAGGELEALRDEQRGTRRYAAELGRLLDVIGSVSSAEESLSERLEVAIGYYRRLLEKNYDDAERRARDLEAVALLGERYSSLEGLLADIAIDPPDVGRDPESEEAEDEWITVSTVHSAKGLEWRVVFVLHLNEGHLPVTNATLAAEDLEEERRLFYVAVTRAKQELFLMRPEQVYRRSSYADPIASPSRFLLEIDLDSLTEGETYVAEMESDSFDELEEGELDEEAFDRIQDYFGT